MQPRDFAAPLPLGQAGRARTGRLKYLFGDSAPADCRRTRARRPLLHAVSPVRVSAAASPYVRRVAPEPAQFTPLLPPDDVARLDPSRSDLSVLGGSPSLAVPRLQCRYRRGTCRGARPS